eukprot:350917-Amphidinium_carterae.3
MQRSSLLYASQNFAVFVSAACRSAASRAGVPMFEERTFDSKRKVLSRYTSACRFLVHSKVFVSTVIAVSKQSCGVA